MTIKRLILLALLGLSLPADTRAQVSPTDRLVEFPDVPGYLTLKCDFHLHTVFSDGAVWPDIRVQEALRDGLDAIALTDHLEYQPHEDDIPHPDRNRSYQIAVESAGAEGLIIINGSEVTRDMPPGHANAILVHDANRLLLDEPVSVFREAKRQGAFIFWNHPNWIAQRPDGMATLTDLHRWLIDEGLLDGIEVVNDLTYSEEALAIALEHDLTIIGTSDIHGLVDWQYDVPYGGHRPVTLVFATERSAAGIQDALEARRTVVWFDNLLIGATDNVVPLIHASLTVTRAEYLDDTSVLRISIENRSDVEYLLENRTKYSFHATSDLVTIKPHETTRLEIKTVDAPSLLLLRFEVLNALTGPGTHPEIVLEAAAN
jgi:hypothetical protein